MDNEIPSCSTKTYSQLILDLSFITKKVSQRTHFETVKDLCDQVWQNILEQAIGYDRVDVVPDDYSNEHPIKAIARLLRGGYETKVSFELNSRIVAKISEFLDNEDNKDFCIP